jgi:YtcA family
MRLRIANLHDRSRSSRSNRSSRSSPLLNPPPRRGGGDRVPRSDGLNRLNSLNGLNSRSLPSTDQHARASLRQIFHFVSIAAVIFAAGCDPIVNIGGTFFPGWTVAILIGSALTAVIRYIFVFTRLEPHIGPLALIYTSLGLLLSVVSWLILYRS